MQLRYSSRLAVLLSAVFSVIVAVACLLCATPALAKTYSIEEVEALISELPNCSDVTEDDRDQIEEALAAYESLSEADQKTVDETDGIASYGSAQPYGRILEVAVWGLWSLEKPDNSTTLPDKTYNGKTVPALSSSYSKGKSTSSRQRPWSVKEVVVKDGKAYATIAVESDSYSDIIIYGDTYPKTNKSGNCEFANVPIDLNTTFYFSGVSTSMPVPIAFSLSTSIDESAEVVETPMDKAKRLIAALPADPFDITIDDTAAILEATAAYEALTDEQKAELCDASKASSIIANSHSYGRYLESAQWTLDSLKPVDNATTLADGTYTGQVESAINWGLSTTLRKLGFSVKSLLVRNGRAYAMLEHASDTSDKLRIGGVEYKNLNTSGSGHSVYEIPIALNSTMHFSVLAKNPTAATNAIAYELTNTADVSSMKPDPVSKTDGSSDDGDNSANQGSEASAANSSAATSPSSDSKLIKKLNKNLNKWLEYITTLLKKQANASNKNAATTTNGNSSGNSQPVAAARTARAATAQPASTSSSNGAKASKASASGNEKDAEEVEETPTEQVDEPQEDTQDSAQNEESSDAGDSVLLVGLATLLAALAGAGGYTVGFVRSENKLKLQ